LAEIYPVRKQLTTGNMKLSQAGVISLFSLLALGVLLLFGAYFLSFTLREFKISEIEEINDRAYYLAEAGIREAVWKLKNDQGWEDNFETDCDWTSEVVSRENTLFPNGSYQFQVKNSDCAQGEITATSTLTFNGSQFLQKGIKVKASKDLITLTKNSAIFSSGESQNITIDASRIKINKGNIFCNNVLDIKNGSEVSASDNPDTEDLEGQVMVVGNLLLSGDSILDAESQCAKNICTEKCDGYQSGITGCPPQVAKVPGVDFDSLDNPNSLKNQAQAKENLGECEILCNDLPCSSKCVLTESEFGSLLKEVGPLGTLTLNNDITYIDGRVELEEGQNLLVQGILAVKGIVNIWKGSSQLTINEPGPTLPSGLLAKAKIGFGKLSSFSEFTATGTIYSEEEIMFEGGLNDFNVVGGILAKKITFSQISQGFDITLDNERVSRALNLSLLPGSSQPSAEYSSVVTVKNWQEAY